MAGDVRYRLAYLLAYPRWREGGRYYRSQLRASLSYRFSIKVFVGWLADLVLGIRR